MMTAAPAFETPLEERDGVLIGPWRTPRQMLSDQEYDGHASIHDDATAQKLGFKGGTIEGPTHFSQLAPLGYAIWKDRWFEEGCLSVQYRAACYEGERVRACMEKPAAGETQVAVWMVREDGTEILRGTASVGRDHPLSSVQEKLSQLKPSEPRVILRDVEPGAKRDRISVRMDADTRMGALYPFSLADKLAVITEPSPLFDPSTRAGPWGRAIVPVEMVSVLLNHLASSDPWTIHGPTVDLFTDQEIAMVAGPVFVGEAYEIEREVVGLSGSRRTESLWIRTSLYRPGEQEPVAVMLLSTASLKESYAFYDRDLTLLAS